MMSQKIVSFKKYHGIGNHFVVLEESAMPKGRNALIDFCKAICNPHTGVGADGVLISSKLDRFVFQMRIINPDGSEPEMCGNGVRCFVKYLLDTGQIKDKDSIVINTLAGDIKPQVKENNNIQAQIEVNMGEPKLSPVDIPVQSDQDIYINQEIKVLSEVLLVTGVSMGNPHAVVFVDDLETFPFNRLGPALSSHSLFPNQCNAEFVQVLSNHEAKMQVWERGAGPTKACGTGACAVLVAGILTKRLGETATIYLPGGPLKISWKGVGHSVFMSGSATFVFSGEYSL